MKYVKLFDNYNSLIFNYEEEEEPEHISLCQNFNHILDNSKRFDYISFHDNKPISIFLIDITIKNIKNIPTYLIRFEDVNTYNRLKNRINSVNDIDSYYDTISNVSVIYLNSNGAKVNYFDRINFINEKVWDNFKTIVKEMCIEFDCDPSIIDILPKCYNPSTDDLKTLIDKKIKVKYNGKDYFTEIRNVDKSFRGNYIIMFKQNIEDNNDCVVVDSLEMWNILDLGKSKTFDDYIEFVEIVD
jgi:hypothetical protein